MSIKQDPREARAEDDAAFRLSRIHAEGWAAARKYLRSGDVGDEKAIAALNPHTTDEERARWYAGFNSAVKSAIKRI